MVLSLCFCENQTLQLKLMIQCVLLKCLQVKMCIFPDVRIKHKLGTHINQSVYVKGTKCFAVIQASED